MVGLSPQITNLVIVLGMMQVSKRIPLDDPTTLNIVRGIYILSNVIILGLYLAIHMKINQKKDLTTLKYVEPAPLGSTEQPKLVTTTNYKYDIEQMQSLYKAQLMGVGMMGVMHIYFKYTNPLMIQSIIPLKGALESNMVKLYLFGQPATGDLKRPFKAAAGLMSGLSGGAPSSDKKTLEAAERSGRGGSKEE